MDRVCVSSNVQTIFKKIAAEKIEKTEKRIRIAAEKIAEEIAQALNDYGNKDSRDQTGNLVQGTKRHKVSSKEKKNIFFFVTTSAEAQQLQREGEGS